MWVACLLALFLDLSVIVDAQCPSQNLVDSHDNRFQWAAVINGERADLLLDPKDKTVYKTDSAPNTVRMNIKINYAKLKLQEVYIETNHAVLVKLQDYALTNEPGNGWQKSTFTFRDEDKLADQIVFLVTGEKSKVQVRNVYAKGCLQINPCDSHLNTEFQKLQEDFRQYWKMMDELLLSSFFTDNSVLIKQDMAIIQGKNDILSYYTSNPGDISSKADIHILRAVQLSENRVYTVHLMIVYKSDQHTLKEPITRIFTLWNKVEDSWKIDVASINEGDAIE